jgi:L-ribulose-5-phosphate 3-epimerase
MPEQGTQSALCPKIQRGLWKFLRRFLVLKITRRKFLGSVVAASLCSRMDFAKEQKLHIGVTDWNLRLGANPEAVSLAAKLGFNGVQISFGRKLVDGKMPTDNPEVIARYLNLSKQHRIPIDGTCVDRLHDTLRAFSAIFT